MEVSWDWDKNCLHACYYSVCERFKSVLHKNCKYAALLYVWTCIILVALLDFAAG